MRSTHWHFFIYFPLLAVTAFLALACPRTPTDPINPNLDSRISFIIDGVPVSLSSKEYFGHYIPAQNYTMYDSTTVNNKRIIIKFPGNLTSTINTSNAGYFEFSTASIQAFAGPATEHIQMIISITNYNGINGLIEGRFYGKLIGLDYSVYTVSNGLFSFIRDKDF